jgi:hypothetical protein
MNPTHESTLQELPSTQSVTAVQQPGIARVEQRLVARLHRSLVHRFASSQSAWRTQHRAIGACTQLPATHVSLVQTSPSLHWGLVVHGPP